MFEVDPRGNTVWQVTSEDLPGIRLAFMTGLQRLPNGNTVMTNWLGHGHFGTAPQVIEVTPREEGRLDVRRSPGDEDQSPPSNSSTSPAT